MAKQVSAAAVHQVLASELDESADDRRKAERCLAEWARKDPTVKTNEESIKLWCALNKVAKDQGGPNARVSQRLFQSYRTKVTASSSLKQMLWVVPRQQLPQLPKKWANFVVAASSLRDLPVNLKAEDFWYLDQGVPRSELPCGTMVHETAVSTERSVEPTATSEDTVPQSATSTPEIAVPRPAVSTAPEPAIAKPAVSKPEASTSARLLSPHSSDETDEENMAQFIAAEISKVLSERRSWLYLI